MKRLAIFGLAALLLTAALGRAQQWPPPGPPPQGMQGPFNDETFGAVSEDGLKFTVLPGPFFKQASVPAIVEVTGDSAAGKAGTLLLYFVDFSAAHGPGSEGLSMAASTNGVQWSAKQSVIVTGKVHRGAVVDPAAVELADGGLRLYFFGPEQTHGDPAGQAGDHKIYSALSQDGLHFQVEPGVRFQMPDITDPEVVRTGQGWCMFLSRGNETLLARSADGLEFSREESFRLRIGGVPGAVVLPDGRVRIFATARDGIVSALYTPQAAARPEAGVRVSRGDAQLAADPSCVRRLNGSYYLVFKKKPAGGNRRTANAPGQRD